MRIICLVAGVALAASVAGGAEPARLLDKANVLPLALEDSFQFRKIKLFLNDPDRQPSTTDRMLNFEREQVNFGAVTDLDKRQRQGHYFTFYWRAKRDTDLVFRLEYRQEKLGAYVQAKEIPYPAAKGSFKTRVDVIGDAYRADGRITAWRAILIEDGRIVGLTQSALWN